MLRASVNKQIAKCNNVTKDEIQSSIHPEIQFKHNSVNLLIGRRGSGKTFNVLRELAFLSKIPHNYTQLIYVTNKLSDDTFHRLKKHISFPIIKVKYEDIEQCIQDIIEAKEDYKEIITKNLEQYIDDETRERVLRTLDVKDFSKNEIHTVVLYDDAAEIFRNRKNKLSRMLFENRQPRITYFLTMQDPFSLDVTVKTNLDTLWIFGGYCKQRFGLIFRQINDCYKENEIWDYYQNLTMHQALVFHFEPTGSRITTVED